ncbi:hypothetical protein JW948_05760 [bacterium]|nr:hypothetical protein [bacterium]
MKKAWLPFMLCNLSFVISCNMNGYHDLAEPVDRFSQLGPGSATFMRTFPSETGTDVELLTLSDPDRTLGTCASLVVRTDPQAVDTKLRLGTYQILQDMIRINYTIEYRNSYMKNSKPSGVPGAVHADIVCNACVTGAWDHDPAAGTITIGNRLFTRFDRVLESVIDHPLPDRPDRFLKMFLLCTMSAHARIDGFNGIGMLQYIDKTTVFNGLLFGSLEFSAEGFRNISTRFRYRNQCDISGIILDGEFRNHSDMSGDGYMDGFLDFTVHGPSRLWEGRVTYTSLEITSTLPSGGVYGVILDGDSSTVSYDYGNPGNFDFSDILEPDGEMLSVLAVQR